MLFAAILMGSAASASAERLCDPSFEDCRTPLLNLIKNETRAIDVAFWFMEDANYSNAIIARWKAGVPVRVIVDPRANSTYPLNADRLAELQAAGIPMRKRIASGILHWKMMLFEAQGTVEFSGANYSPWAFKPVTPYVAYTDEAVYFSTDPSVVNSFRAKYDSLWIDTTKYANYANITTPVARYPAGTFTKDPELNFPPEESYRSRAVKLYNAETEAIDVTMFRITDQAHSDAMIAAVARGVPVRLITDPDQYREPSRYWDAWNVDRMYVGGVQIRMSAHQGINHQKSVVLQGQGVTIFGSSNWTSPSSNAQQEHNYFTKKAAFYNWFNDQFDRKWTNRTGNVETKPFVPLPPDRPTYVGPADLASGLPTTGVTLQWLGGFWAHKYDVCFGTIPEPPCDPANANLPLGPSTNSRQVKSFALPTLQPGTTYYWKIISKTMANVAKVGAIRSFTTAGSATPPATTSTLGAGDVLIYAGTPSAKAGTWTVVSDATAAGGRRMSQSNQGVAKITTPSATPANYFEVTFQANANTPYHLWMRMRATTDSYANDSVYVQFSDSLDSAKTSQFRIGTTSALTVILEDCSGCGLAAWGWQDNGWGTNVLGPPIYFATSGTHTLRVQNREDGVWIDQILLSPQRYASVSPGALKNDATILPESPSPYAPPTASAADTVLHTSKATVIAGNWQRTTDQTAADATLLWNPNRNAAKIATALPDPADYFEMTFTAAAGRPYRMWLRGRAENNYYGNDSVHVQFSDTVDQHGTAVARIGSTDSMPVVIEDCNGCGVSGWGWQDNGYGSNVFGPPIYFAAGGSHTMRVQVREDGIGIDQIVLSPSTYLETAPGALKNDSTILPENAGG